MFDGGLSCSVLHIAYVAVCYCVGPRVGPIDTVANALLLIQYS